MSDQDDALLDLRERGAAIDGEPQRLDHRLFMQLLVLDLDNAGPQDAHLFGEVIHKAGMSVVIYEDVNQPKSFGILTFSTEPKDFTEKTRAALRSPDLPDYRVRNEMTMLGRAYSTGYEPDLEYWMVRRPQETVLNGDWPWAIWYPLRRGGHFEKLEPREKGGILREHAEIGKQYGHQDLAHDVRLACHGLDANDNEFVIGLMGKNLHPLSHVVQRMRRTRQTSEYITQMGPFFVGRAVYQKAAHTPQ
ncbi:MAG: chlorite dismutase family protein [Polyangiaceae bacterium]|nr:chlorite dismutase family protein [Polyangiaceae bacterium]